MWTSSPAVVLPTREFFPVPSYFMRDIMNIFVHTDGYRWFFPEEKVLSHAAESRVLVGRGRSIHEIAAQPGCPSGPSGSM